MNIEIKKSQKPVKYEDALRIMEDRLLQIDQKKSKDFHFFQNKSHHNEKTENKRQTRG